MWFEEKGNLEVKDNQLYFAGKSTLELAEKYGTPTYFYNGNKIKENFLKFKNAFDKQSKNYLVKYAVKANSHFQILKLLQKEGAGIDAVSPLEVELALKAGFEKEKILFTGTQVSNKELQKIINLGVLINIDSFSMLRRLSKIGGVKKVSIRWNPGMGAGVNPKVITAGKFMKFGIPEDKIIEATEKAKELGFEIIGLHQHIGSGWLSNDVEMFLKTVSKSIKVGKQIEKIMGKELEFIDLGGGPGIRYKPNDKEFPIKKYVEGIVEIFKKNNCNSRIEIEPGRYLAGEASVLLTEINTVEEKNIPLIGINAGFNTLQRPAMYGAYHEMIICNTVESNQTKEFMVGGNVCETGDVFNQNKKELRKLPIPTEGDILAILSSGAYGACMASNYNTRSLPKEVLILNNKDYLITKEQTLNEIISNQILEELK